MLGHQRLAGPQRRHEVVHPPGPLLELNNNRQADWSDKRLQQLTGGMLSGTQPCAELAGQGGTERRQAEHDGYRDCPPTSRRAR